MSMLQTKRRFPLGSTKLLGSLTRSYHRQQVVNCILFFKVDPRMWCVAHVRMSAVTWNRHGGRNESNVYSVAQGACLRNVMTSYALVRCIIKTTTKNELRIILVVNYLCVSSLFNAHRQNHTDKGVCRCCEIFWSQIIRL